MKLVSIEFSSTTTVPPPVNRRINGTFRLLADLTCTISCGLPEMPSTIAGCATPSLMTNQSSGCARKSASSISSCRNNGNLDNRRRRTTLALHEEGKAITQSAMSVKTQVLLTTTCTTSSLLCPPQALIYHTYSRTIIAGSRYIYTILDAFICKVLNFKRVFSGSSIASSGWGRHHRAPFDFFLSSDVSLQPPTTKTAAAAQKLSLLQQVNHLSTFLCSCTLKIKNRAGA